MARKRKGGSDPMIVDFKARLRRSPRFDMQFSKLKGKVQKIRKSSVGPPPSPHPQICFRLPQISPSCRFGRLFNSISAFLIFLKSLRSPLFHLLILFPSSFLFLNSIVQLIFSVKSMFEETIRCVYLIIFTLNTDH